MINGIFLDPRIWKIDYLTDPFWSPDSFGIHIDLHPDAFNIPKYGISEKYKFVITTEVWELPIQKTLEFLKHKGLKIILIPREVAKTKAHLGTMFGDQSFKHKDQFYFKPDLLLAPGSQYFDLWDGKDVNRKIIGYPRYEIYLRSECLRTKDEAIKRHAIEKNKKIIFFPSYPTIYVQTINGKSVYSYLNEDLENTMCQLEQYAINNINNIQVIVKIHPYAQKCYDKKAGPVKEVFGLLEKYYKKPTKYLKVIGDSRLDSSVSRDMIIAADFVVGSISMMMLEAAIVNKPVLNIRLRQEQQLKDTITYEGNIPVVHEVCDIPVYLDDMIHFPSKYIVNKDFVEHYLYKVDGKFCERLCESIKELVI